MGIIANQSLRSTIYTYLGAGIGFFNSMILFPSILDSESKGLLDFLNSITSIFSSFFILGMPLIVLKLFPRFRTEGSTGHNGFFSFTLLVSLIGFVLGVGIFFGFHDLFIAENNEARNYIYFIPLFLVLFFFRIVQANFDSFIMMLYNTVLGMFTTQVLIRVVTLAALLLFLKVEGVDYNILVFLFVLALILPGVVNVFYVVYKKLFNLNLRAFFNHVKPFKAELYSLGLFGLLGGLGGTFLSAIDGFMVSNMLGLSENGIYTTSAFFGFFISMPARGVTRIASVVVSESWKRNDLKSIDDIYKKSCGTLFLIAGYLFVGVVCCVEYAYELMKPEYAQGLYVAYIIGLAHVVDMLTGVNTDILYTSKYYKYQTYFMAVLVLIVIVLNYFFIPIWGINGAAFSTLLSMVIVNTFRTLFLYKKFGFQPYNYKTLLILLVIVFTIGMVKLVLPHFENLYVGVLVTGTFLTALYWVPAYFFKLSDEVNGMINKYLRIKN